MRTAAVLLLGLLAVSANAHAGQFEVTASVGEAFPTYRQTVTLNPGGITVPGTGITIPPESPLMLDARGGLVFSGTVVFHPLPFLGLEARVDSTDIQLDTRSAVYRAQLDFPAPAPDLIARLELGGPLDVQPITAYSLNLRLRTPGRIRLLASGGLSYLPSLRLRGADAIRFTLTDLQGRPVPLGFESVAVSADAEPGTSQGRFGGNFGVGLQIDLGRSFALTAEARGFVFPEHRLRFRLDPGRTLTPLETAIGDQVEAAVAPVDFDPTFFQATAGLTLRF